MSGMDVTVQRHDANRLTAMVENPQPVRNMYVTATSKSSNPLKLSQR